MESEKNYITMADGMRRPAMRGGVREELTGADILHNHYQYARTMSDKELRRHFTVSTRHGDTCGECFCCVCGRVLQERRIEKIRNTPEHKAKVDKMVTEAERHMWEKHLTSSGPK